MERFMEVWGKIVKTFNDVLDVLLGIFDIFKGNANGEENA